MKALLEECINELCLYCGKYQQEYAGACEGCKYYAFKRGDYKRNVNSMLDVVEDLIVNCEAEECYRTEVDEDGTEHKYPCCPFVDRNGYCKIGDPLSWDVK